MTSTLTDYSSARSLTKGSEGGSTKQNDWDKYQPIDRSFWWKSQIKDTPNPGSYKSHDFLYDLQRNPVKNSYRFKSDGRRRQPFIVPSGQTLLPGAYNNDAINMHFWLKKSINSYGFRSTGRDANDGLNQGLIDKDLNLAPGQYNTDQYLSIDGTKQNSKHMVFRSRTKREIKEFLPREGPDPCKYDPILPPSISPIKSSFQSTASRFVSSTTKYPGPGSYDKTYQSPMPASLMRMGRHHGLFFSSAFQC